MSSNTEVQTLVRIRILKPEIAFRRKQIRLRALLFAEYCEFSRLLQQKDFLHPKSKFEWRVEVIRIEQCLLEEEPEVYKHIHCDIWEPLNQFFVLKAPRVTFKSVTRIDLKQNEVQTDIVYN